MMVRTKETLHDPIINYYGKYYVSSPEGAIQFKIASNLQRREIEQSPDPKAAAIATLKRIGILLDD